MVYGVAGSGAAPDGGAAGGVRDVHTIAEQLGDELRVRSLAAARAGAGELKQRLLELAALDAGLLELLDPYIRRHIGIPVFTQIQRRAVLILLVELHMPVFRSA